MTLAEHTAVKFVFSLDNNRINVNCKNTWMITYSFALDFIYVRRISLAQCFINYEFRFLIFTRNLSRLTYITIRAALGKNCSRALPLHSYRPRGAESPFSRSNEKGSHRTPAWKLIILRFEKIDLVQQNDFPHRILGYLTYTCVFYSHENTIVTAKIEKFRRCTHHCFILAA